MAKKFFGLDISDYSIEAVLVKKSLFGKARVVSYARTILRGEVVRNGVVKKPDKLAEAITRVLASAEPRPIKTKQCIVSIPDSQAFTTIFKLPAGLRHGEIKNTIPFKAEEVIPFKATEVYFDFKSISRKEGTQEVFYAAAPVGVVDSLIGAITAAGLQPLALDLESVSLARALISPATVAQLQKAQLGEVVLLIDIGARTSNFTIFDRNGIRHSASSTVAGNKFTRTIVNNLSIKPKDADALKFKEGVKAKDKSSRVTLILQKELQTIIKEASRLMTYYQDETGRKVGLIVLAGGSSLLPGIDEYLSANLGTQVVVGDPFDELSVPVSLKRLKSKRVLFSNVIGLALRAVSNDPVHGDINLMPISKQRFAVAPAASDRFGWRKVYIGAAIFGLLAIVLGGLFFLQQRGVRPYNYFMAAPASPEFTADISLEVYDEIIAQLMLATPTPTTTTPFGDQLFVVVLENEQGYLDIFDQPSATGQKIGQATSTDSFAVINTEVDWYEIVLSASTTGWVAKDFVEYFKPVQAALPAGNSQPQPDQADDAPVVVPTRTLEILETSLGYLNVRQGAGTNFPKIGQVGSGEAFTILDEQVGWYEIEFDDNQTGWVSGQYVSVIEE